MTDERTTQGGALGSGPAPGGKAAPLRVVFIWNGITKVGGVETFLRQCLELLPAQGLEPLLLDLPSRAAGAASAELKNVHNVPRLGDSRWSYERRVFARLAALRPRVVVFNDWVASWLAGSVPAAVRQVGISHVDHDNPAYYAKAAAAAPATASLVGVSPRIVTRLREVIGPVHAERASFIPYGVTLPPAGAAPQARPRPPGEPLRLIYFGRLVEHQKRAQDIAPFVEALAASGTPFVLTIIGQGECEATLRERLAGHVQAGRVRMLGPKPHEEVLHHLRGQEVYLLFSTHEGLPISLLESLAVGLVPVVTRVPSGVSEILSEGETARFFPIGEPARGAAIVRELARDPGQCARMSAAALALGQRFSLENMVRSYAELLGGLARGVDAERAWAGAGFSPTRAAGCRAAVHYMTPAWLLKPVKSTYRALRYGAATARAVAAADQEQY